MLSACSNTFRVCLAPQPGCGDAAHVDLSHGPFAGIDSRDRFSTRSRSLKKKKGAEHLYELHDWNITQLQVELLVWKWYSGKQSVFSNATQAYALEETLRKVQAPPQKQLDYSNLSSCN